MSCCFEAGNGEGGTGNEAFASPSRSRFSRACAGRRPGWRATGARAVACPVPPSPFPALR